MDGGEFDGLKKPGWNGQAPGRWQAALLAVGPREEAESEEQHPET